MLRIDPARDPFKHFMTPSHSLRTDRRVLLLILHRCWILKSRPHVRFIKNKNNKNSRALAHTPFMQLPRDNILCPGTPCILFSPYMAAGITTPPLRNVGRAP